MRIFQRKTFKITLVIRESPKSGPYVATNLHTAMHLFIDESAQVSHRCTVKDSSIGLLSNAIVKKIYATATLKNVL